MTMMATLTSGLHQASPRIKVQHKPQTNVHKNFLAQAQRLGFDVGYVDMLLSTDHAHTHIDQLWSDFIENFLDITDFKAGFDAHHRHIAVAGDIASGKSTILAQLACHILRKDKNEDVIFALCENASGAVNELLSCIARILGAPVLYVRSAQELLYELDTLGDKRRFLIDLPSKPAEQLLYLEHFKNTQFRQSVGILCALARRAELLATQEAMQLWLKYSHGWVLSFASEAAPIGYALSMACKSPRPLAYIAKSHDFLEGLSPASAPQLKSLIMSAITRLNQGQMQAALVS